MLCNEPNIVYNLGETIASIMNDMGALRYKVVLVKRSPGVVDNFAPSPL